MFQYGATGRPNLDNMTASAMNGDKVCTALILEFRANAYLRDLESKKPVNLTTNEACKEMLFEAGKDLKLILTLYSHE